MSRGHAEGHADLLHRDGRTTVRHGDPFFTVGATPAYELPLVFVAVLALDFVEQRHLRVGQVIAVGVMFQRHGVVLAAADAVLPALVRFAQETPGVNEVQHF